MPQPRSARFDATQQTPHNPIVRADLLDGGNNIIQRDIPMMPDGETVGDRTAANALVRTLNVPLAGLTAAAQDELQNDLADTYLQTYRGIRYEDTLKLGMLHNSAATWTPQSSGQMIGTTVNGSNQLQMGP
jgi:hypothetical protein